MESAQVEELVLAWRQAREHGESVTVADLCRDCPELAEVVARRVAAIRRRADGTEMIPSASVETTGAAARSGPVSAALPHSLGGYRIEGLLGEGGMGAVYLGRDERLGRSVALKTMKPEIAAYRGAKERFLREARVAAQVEHDNIIPIWQVGEDGGIPFIAMPLLQGESLACRLQRERLPSLGVTLKVGKEVAEGLSAAHARGLIHRDIKPANVWLEGDPKGRDAAARFRRCKLLDFGLARPEKDDAHLTATGLMVGTPAYMSPEQAAGKTIDHRTDLFSLGVLLYRMTTGELPFAGPTVMSILTSLAIHEPPPPVEKNPSLPTPLSDLIMKLLTKDPAGRPGSARDVASALREIIRELAAKRKAGAVSTDNPWADLNTAMAPPPRTAPARRKAGPPGWWKWVAAALTAVLAVIVAGVVVIRVIGPDGKVTEFEVPDGSTVTIDKEGGYTIQVPKDDKPSPRPTKSDPAPGKVRVPAGEKATVKPTQAVPVQKPRPQPMITEADRRAAEWALACGGKVVVRVGEGHVQVAAVKDLPAKLCPLVRVLLNGCGDKVTDAGLEGVKGLGHLTHLYLGKTAVTDAGLEHVRELTSLIDVHLGDTRITDAGLANLKGLSNLVQLAVFKTDITDAGLDHLKGLGALDYLDVSSTRITDAGLDKISALSRLWSLDVSYTEVTDIGLARLKELTALKALALGGVQSPLTDAGLAHLAEMTKLTTLGVSGPALTDRGLQHLKGLTELTHLSVYAPKLTDAGLDNLKGLSKLTELHLYKTKVTPAGAEKLGKALPTCKVVFH